jgi:hypothetical protein
MGVMPPTARTLRAAAVAVLALVAAAQARAAGRSALLQTVKEAEVDWEAGSVTVHAGAAADLRLPGPDAARPAARRAAEKRAAQQLRLALEALPVGGGHHLPDAAITAALGKARARDVDYESNGGVTLALAVDFADLGTLGDLGEKPRKDAGPALERAPSAAKARAVEPASAAGEEVPALLLSVPSMPLELAPRLLVAGKERTLGSAVYRLGEAPKARKAHTAKRDKSGRLVVTLPEPEATRAEGGQAIIYVRSVLKK